MEAESIRILLVEDDPEDMQLLEYALGEVRNLRYTLSRAGQLKALGGLLQAQSFDVLLLDLHLPDSQGLATVSQAMNQAPGMPIVVLTSVDDEGTGMEAMRCGAQDYLVKGEADGWLIVKTMRHAVERKRVQKELQYSVTLAGEAQRALLPTASPPEWTHFRATARNQMCGSVGGDFYDFIRLNEQQVAVFIGDIMGHDVRAALLMAQVLGFLRSEPKNRTTQVVSALNQSLLALGHKLGTALTCSLFYAILDAPSETAYFANAGHPSPYVYDPRTGKTHPLGSNGYLLGVQRFEAVEMSHALDPSARLVLYTDGILDAANTAGERFGGERLAKAIRRHAAQGPNEFADGIIAEVRDFRQGAAQMDDESVVVVDRL